VIATVREWSDEEGWGVLSADDTPGDIFLHFSNIQMDGYKSLQPGEQVEVEVRGGTAQGRGLPVRGFGRPASALIRGLAPNCPRRAESLCKTIVHPGR
jgi:cold shock CspA family protein